MANTADRSLPTPDAVRLAVADLARAEGIRLAVLFGSLARGEQHPRDVDIALLGDGGLDLVDLTNRLTPVLRTQHVDLADLRGADPLLMALVARDGVALFEATPGEFDRFASLAARRFADTAKFREAERLYIADFIQRHGAA
jgi:predicted nucleotidyltransferase